MSNLDLNLKIAYILNKLLTKREKNMSPRKKRFEFLEHTADLYVAAFGKSLEETFENAALAMFEGMTDLTKVQPKQEDKIEVKGHDEQALLYNWLEALLVKFDIADSLYSRFKVERIEKTSQGFKLKAHIWGEPFDKEKHLSKVGVKAVTYHQMEITKQPNLITVKFILDV